MLSLDDNRWANLTGGYRVKCDPRPLLAKLETEQDPANTWHELWDELHHQGDVGEASYASVPEIVRIYRKRDADWNAFAIVAIIELARKRANNPEVPKWLEADYIQAIQELAQTGAREILHANDPDTVRAILGVIAIAKGLPVHGRFLVDFSEEEVLDIESRI